jgi:hypothetical protein
MLKPLRVALEVHDCRIIERAADWRQALVEADNLLEMQTELRPGWRLRIEADEGPLKLP